MEQVLNKNNSISVPKKIVYEEKLKKTTKANKVVKKLSIQIIVCCIIITSIYLYKIYNASGFEYLNDKYSWIVKYNMTYTDAYNKIASYLNTKFQFKIPLKQQTEKVEQEFETSENIIKDNAVENLLQEEQIINQNEEAVVLASAGYDNMRVLAEEVKNKYQWNKPVNGEVTSPFGVRDPSRVDISSFHMGIDVANGLGTEIVSAIDGEVIEATYNNVYGNYVKISKDDLITIYAHCSKLIVKKGDKVKSGEKIALMGSTGVSTGSHLHFEIRKDNQVINPEYVINFR